MPLRHCDGLSRILYRPVRRPLVVGIGNPRELEEALRAAYYLADAELSTAAYLALALGKPLLLEGAPGVGKTEAAKAIAGADAGCRGGAVGCSAASPLRSRNGDRAGAYRTTAGTSAKRAATPYLTACWIDAWVPRLGSFGSRGTHRVGNAVMAADIAQTS